MSDGDNLYPHFDPLLLAAQSLASYRAVLRRHYAPRVRQPNIGPFPRPDSAGGAVDQRNYRPKPVVAAKPDPARTFKQWKWELARERGRRVAERQAATRSAA